MNLLKKYWAELLVLGAVFGVLLICCIPDITWINTDCDGPHYIYSAKYLYPAHKTSAPLFLLLGHLFLKLPFGTEAWRFSMLSVLATMTAVVFIYLIVRSKTGNKRYGIAAGLVYGSSALVISQSIIIESYALVAMFGVIAYYFAEKKKWLWAAVMLGAGGAVHHLIGIPIVVLLIANKELRSWKCLGVMASFLLFYAFIPLSKYFGNPPEMWANTNLRSFFTDNLTTALMLIGGLSIWDLPKRIFDTIGLLGVSLGLAVLPMVWFLKIRHNDPNPIRKKHWKEPLLWMFFLPIVYYASDLSPQTYVYAMPSIAFGAIIAGIGLSRMNWRWTWAVAGIAVLMLGFNGNYFDVGRTLDPELSARKFYDEELAKIPDGQILLAQQGWEWAIIYPYNKDEGRNVVPVCIGTLASPGYRTVLEDLGVDFRMPNDMSKMTLTEIQDFVTLSIIENNENTWTTLPTSPETYGAEIVLAKGNEKLMTGTPKSITDGSMDMKWRWRPDSPYNIITGAIEIEGWSWLVFSNYTVLLFTMLGTIGFVPVWIGWNLLVRRKKWRPRNIVSRLRTAS